jgi:hypothetical protein
MLALSNLPNRVCISHRLPEDGVSETSRSVVFFRIPDIAQTPKPSNPEFYTSSSEPFRIYKGKFTLSIETDDKLCKC